MPDLSPLASRPGRRASRPGDRRADGYDDAASARFQSDRRRIRQPVPDQTLTMQTGLTEIIASGLESAAAEMCASLIRTAYSPNIKERGDCSTAICDMQGRTLTLFTHAPAHLGSTLLLVPAVLQRFPVETLKPGDVFFANDP